MRHGPAAERASTGADFDRPLTSAGVEQTSAAARGLKRLGVKRVAILSSPLVRARQTAELVAAELPPGEPPEIVDALASGAAPGEILKAIRGRDGDLLLVGHDPDFSALVTYLLSGATQPFIDFAKSGVLALDFHGGPESGSGELLWYLRRKHLALLGS